MPHPLGYLRKSKLNTKVKIDPSGKPLPGKNWVSLSWEVQEDQVRQLAARHGDENLELLSDWGASGAKAAGAFGGTGRGGRRRTWQLLTAQIDAGDVSVLYAYSLSRLARSTKELLELGERCAKAGTIVRLAKEGTLDFTSAHGRLYLTVLAAVATFEAEVSAEKARDHVQLRLSRGDHVGQAPYGMQLREGKLSPNPAEPVEHILETFRAERSLHGTARRLNSEGFASRQGKRWSDTTVGRVIRRVAPDDIAQGYPGTRRRSTHILSGLLICPHCGGPMTAAKDTVKGRYYVNYFCWRASGDSSHARPYKIAETRLLPPIQVEAARFRLPTLVALEADQARHDGLTARKRRILDNYEDGLIERAERDAKLLAIDNEIEMLDMADHVRRVPTEIDWAAPRDAINAVLRTFFDRIELGSDLMPRPDGFVWRLPREYLAP